MNKKKKFISSALSTTLTCWMCIGSVFGSCAHTTHMHYFSRLFDIIKSLSLECGNISLNPRTDQACYRERYRPRVRVKIPPCPFYTHTHTQDDAYLLQREQPEIYTRYIQYLMPFSLLQDNLHPIEHLIPCYAVIYILQCILLAYACSCALILIFLRICWPLTYNPQVCSRWTWNVYLLLF